MDKAYILDKTFEHQDFRTTGLEDGEYEACSFINCDFSGIALSGRVFVDCTFKGCNLGLAKLVQTAFCNTMFVECKLIGLRFEHCRPFLFSAGFDNCQLNMSSFHGMKLKKTRFSNCTMHETDFTEADLAEAVFDNCDLAGAIFEQTNLEKADFSTAYNYGIDPANNRIRQAHFSRSGIEGLLRKYAIRIS